MGIIAMDLFIKSIKMKIKRRNVQNDQVTQFYPENTLVLKSQINPEGSYYSRIIQNGNALLLFNRDIFEMNLDTMEWKKYHTPNYPHLSGFTVVHDKMRNEFIIFGGIENVILHYSQKTNKILVRQTEIALMHHSAVIYNDRMYVFGGVRQDKEILQTSNIDTYTYNLSTFKWTNIMTRGDVPKKIIYDQAEIDHENRIFLNGCHGLYEFHPETRTWELLRSSNGNGRIDRFHKRTMVSVGKYLYFIGAFEGNRNVYRFDKQTKKIEFYEGELMQDFLESHSSCLVHHRSKSFIYTLGGHSRSFSEMYHDLYELDVTNESMNFAFKEIHEFILQKQKLMDIKFLYN